jgi:hypothetical protein
MKRRAQDRDITATVEVRDMNYAILDISQPVQQNNGSN